MNFIECGNTAQPIRNLSLTTKVDHATTHSQVRQLAIGYKM
jgi:hypothetical protein